MDQKVNVLFFGLAAEIAQTNKLSIHAANTDELKKVIEDTYPTFQQLTYAVAVNHTIIHQNKSLTATDEVAILPPYSGG